MLMRRLNEPGIAKLSEFLDSLTTDAPQAYPQAILTDSATSQDLPVDIEVEVITFPRRFDVAKHLFDLFSMNPQFRPEQDSGLWAWLTLLWFDQLCRVDKKGRRKPGQLPLWVPELHNPRRYYRHLLLGPYLVYCAHSNNPFLVEPILCDPMHVSTSEQYRTVVETQQFVTCPSVLGAIRELFYDSRTGRLRRGSSTKGPGGVRRFGDLLSQFDRTFDLHSIRAESLVGLLPSEFKILGKKSRVA